MDIRIDPHTLERSGERGTTEEEIRDVLESGFPVVAKHGRLAKAKVYEFGRRRQKKYYEQKRVEVVCTIEEDALITVTVYVFYGRWEA
ncbi:MAG: DUF4258 domain-containing protein [Chloroflexi bacterium]|nr:DUF4258 domain-containing protein [Chloroflexota bacterium]